ncbi:MAG: MMPL family transporter [Planctomycetes bacterium]|nr:MMPL family transporter [Planctomycetota bacterium]
MTTLRPSLLTLGHWLVRRRVPVLVAVVLAAVVLALGLRQLQVGFAVDAFFRSGGDPELAAALQHYREPGLAPPDSLLAFGWSEAEPLGAAARQRIDAFVAVAEADPLVRSVISLRGATVPGHLGSTPAEVAASRTWRDLLVARTGDAVGGFVVLERSDDLDGMAALFEALRIAMAGQGAQLNLCGLPYHRVAARRLVRNDLAWFLPVGTAVSAVFLFWLVPHWLLALQALLVVPLVLVSTLGTMAWCGVGMTMLTSTLPTLLLCMSVADGVHMVGRFLEERGGGHDPRAAAARTFAALLVPCLLTSLTTCVGFLTLCTAGLRDLLHLGAFAALGMGYAFVFTMTILPATMSFVASPVGRRPRDPASGLVRLSLAALRVRPAVWVGLAALGFVFAAVACRGLQADHRMTGDLWPDSAEMRQMRFYEQHFAGVIPAEVVARCPTGFTGAAFTQLGALCRHLEEDPGVSRTLSIVDLVDDGMPLALVRGLSAAGALPAGLLSPDGQTARVLAFRGDLGTRAWRQFAASVESFASAVPVLQVQLAGMQAVGTVQVLRMTEDLEQSFFGSIAVVFVLVLLSCRSLRLSLIAVVTCLLPLLCVLAAMALGGVSLRPLTMIAFCVAFGLMIDDAIHLVARWQEERRSGRVGDGAVRATLATAGRPVCVTTVLLLVGFVVILGSEFRGTFAFGALVTTSLTLSLVAALVLLPALLRVFGVRRGGDTGRGGG